MKLNLRRLMRPSDVRTCIGGAGIIAAIAAGMANQGCSALQSACAETAAERASAGILISDAEARLAEAKDVIVKIANEDIRSKAIVAYDAAMQALDASRHILAGTKDMCEAVDVQAAFSEFVAAWKTLAPFLALLGGPSAGSQVKAPMVVGM